MKKQGKNKRGHGDSALLSETAWVGDLNQRPPGQVGNFAFGQMSEGWSGEHKQQAKLPEVGTYLESS